MGHPKQKWLPLFEAFIKELRIQSKEIATTDPRGAPLDLWGSQQIALESLCEGMDRGVRTFLYLKARQLGISTVFLAVDLFFLALHPGTIGALVTESETNRAIFRETLERYVASFPPNFFGKSFTIKRANKDFILFSNNSRLDFIVAGTSAKRSWGEGRGYALAHLTETAAYGSAEGLAGFRETLAEKNPNRLFIYESTAKGFNHYRDLWIEFGNDEYTKKRTFIGWWSKEINEIHKTDPRWKAYGVAPPGPEERELIEKVETDYGFKVTQPKLAWYRWRHSDEASNDATLHQNLPWTADQAFVMSGHSFFQTRVLQKDMERCIGLPFRAYRYWLGNDFFHGKMEEIWEEERSNEIQLRVWEQPDPDGMYVIGCDPAYGRNDNKDRHAICVLRCFADKLIQVAEYADNNVETRQCAWVLAHLAGAYRNCIINVEITGPGGVILTEIEHLREIMKLNAEFDERTKKNDNWEDFLGNARWYIYNKPDSFGPGHVKCWETSWKTKFQFMNQVRDNYSTGIIEVNSIRLIEEMLNVVQDGSSIGAPGNSKDDRVFALALANRIWIDHLRIGMIARRETYAEAMLQQTEGVDIKGKMVSNIVGNFFKTAEQIALEGDDDTPQWMRDRGFV